MNRELTTLNERWREKAELFRQHGHEATARTYGVCSAELEAALRGTEEELLDLQEVSREPGFSSRKADNEPFLRTLDALTEQRATITLIEVLLGPANCEKRSNGRARPIGRAPHAM